MSDLVVDIRTRAGDFVFEGAFSAGSGITAIFGKSGAGKSTLLRTIAGLVRPERGRIALAGRVLDDTAGRARVPARDRRVGYVFQDDRLFPHMTARRNMLYGADRGPAANLDFDAIVAMLGLGDLLDRSPATLSGGERKRVAIARALLSGPRILLMDEPLASLDHARRNVVMPYLERVRDETDIPILYVSHEIDEVARLADTLVVLSEGQIVASGETTAVFAELDLGPALGRHEAGALLEGTVSGRDERYDLVSVDVEDQTLQLALHSPGESPLVPGTRLRLRVRARDVSLSLARLNGVSIRNQLPMIVDSIRPEAGAFAEVRGRVGAQYLRARVTRQTVDDLGLTPGMTVHALIKAIAFDRRLVQKRPDGA